MEGATRVRRNPTKPPPGFATDRSQAGFPLVGVPDDGKSRGDTEFWHASSGRQKMNSQSGVTGR